jgi:hypothetical protein
MDNKFLPYDPGILPWKASPSPGDKLILELPGVPPRKATNRSIRNKRHPHHSAFLALRSAAILAMDGRAWTFGPVKMDLTVFSPNPIGHFELNDYFGGIMDTLDGSSGTTFTFLPIVFEDDCQLASGDTNWALAKDCHYKLKITFLPELPQTQND